MEFTVEDIELEGLSESQKKAWVTIANKAYKESKLDKAAIKQANFIASKMPPETMPVAGELAHDLMNEANKHKDEPAEMLREAIEIVEEATNSPVKMSYDKGKSWTDFREADGNMSFEQIRSDIRKKIREKLKPLNGWAGVSETFSDYVIIYVEKENSANIEHYKYPYQIGENGKITFDNPIEVKKVTSWEPIKQDMNESDLTMEGCFVPLVESKSGPIIDNNGKAKIKLIKPGWGESAYYKPEVLQEGAKVFKDAKMYWNHPTEEEEQQRPEGDLNNLAAVIDGEPEYDTNGPDGAGLYAEAKVFDKYKEPIEELASHIGLSIRAGGTGQHGEIEGKEGLIAESIKVGKSVDFVTEPGAGGEILPLFEAAGRGEWEQVKNNQNFEEGDDEVKIGDITLEQLQESRPDLIESLTESNTNEENEESVDLKEAQKRINRLEEKLLLKEAGSYVSDQLSNAKLPKRTKQRLYKEAISTVDTDEDGKLDKEALKESVKDLVDEAIEEIAEISESGKIEGMGESHEEDESQSFEESQKELVQNFKDMGLSEEMAKQAAKGRN